MEPLSLLRLMSALGFFIGLILNLYPEKIPTHLFGLVSTAKVLMVCHYTFPISIMVFIILDRVILP